MSKVSIPPNCLSKKIRVWRDHTFFFKFSVPPPMITQTWQKLFPKMETARILLKLAGGAWHRESFQSKQVIMTKCQESENQG